MNDSKIQALQNIYNWLKSHGVMKKIISLYNQSGKEAAIGACSSYFPNLVCSDMIGLLL